MNEKEEFHAGRLPSNSLRRFTTVFFKRKKLVLSVFSAAVLIVTAASFLMPPVYRASSKILVEKEGSADKSMLFRFNLPMTAEGYDWIKSEMEIITSYPVVSGVIKELGSDDLKLADRKNEDGLQFEKAVKKFLKRLSVDNMRNSNVIEVSYESKDPQLAAATSNRLIQQYLDHRSAIHDESKTYRFFETQMQVTEGKLSALEQRLSDYKNKEGIVSPETQAKILLNKLADYEKILTNVLTTRIGKEAKLSVIENQLRKREALINIPATDVSDSPSREKYIVKLKSELLGMEIERGRLLQRFQPTYEDIVELEKQIEATKEIVKSEIQEIVEQEKTAIQALIAEEAALKKSIEEITQRIRSFARKEYEFAQLNRGIADNQEVYSMLLKQREEARISLAKLDRGVKIKIISPAVVPQKPIKPRKRLNVALGIFLGLMLVLGLALFVEYNDHSIYTPEDLEKLTGLSALGSIREINCLNVRLDGGYKESFAHKS